MLYFCYFVCVCVFVGCRRILCEANKMIKIYSWSMVNLWLVKKVFQHFWEHIIKNVRMELQREKETSCAQSLWFLLHKYEGSTSWDISEMQNWDYFDVTDFLSGHFSPFLLYQIIFCCDILFIFLIKNIFQTQLSQNINYYCLW